jgi:hypothetical protein
MQGMHGKMQMSSKEDLYHVKIMGLLALDSSRLAGTKTLEVEVKR